MRWSNSALYVAQQCGEKFRRMYIERDFRPSGISAKRGTAAHKVANEAHMRQLRAKQEGRPREEYLTAVLPTAEEAKDIAADSFQRAHEGCAFCPLDAQLKASIARVQTVAEKKPQPIVTARRVRLRD